MFLKLDSNIYLYWLTSDLNSLPTGILVTSGFFLVFYFDILMLELYCDCYVKFFLVTNEYLISPYYNLGLLIIVWDKVRFNSSVTSRLGPNYLNELSFTINDLEFAIKFLFYTFNILFIIKIYIKISFLHLYRIELKTNLK